jgi:hypothetical protein
VPMVRLIEALAWKQGVNELAREPTDTGSKLNLSSTLHSDQDGARVLLGERGGMETPLRGCARVSVNKSAQCGPRSSKTGFSISSGWARGPRC